MTKKATFRSEIKITANKQNGLVEVENIVLMRDIAMHGSIRSYTPPEVLAASVEAGVWENVPIVADDHVWRDDIPSHTVGGLKSAFMDDDKLTAYGVVNLDKLLDQYPILYYKLINGEPINGSVAIYFDGELVDNGIYKDRVYDYLITNITEAEHYAMLKGVGACSIDDGCGFGVNNSKEAKMPDKKPPWLDELLNEVRQGKKLEASHITECEQKQLIGRLSTAEGQLTTNKEAIEKLSGELAGVLKENEELKTRLGETEATLTQFKNNQAGVTSNTEDTDPDSYF
jgi:hypothetical protein